MFLLYTILSILQQYYYRTILFAAIKMASVIENEPPPPHLQKTRHTKRFLITGQPSRQSEINSVLRICSAERHFIYNDYVIKLK